MKHIIAAAVTLMLMTGYAAAQEKPETKEPGGYPGRMAVICNKSDIIEKYLTEQKFKKIVIGRGSHGMLFELWNGVYESKAKWTLMFYDDNNKIRCQIDTGFIGEDDISVPPEEPKKPDPTPKNQKQ